MGHRRLPIDRRRIPHTKGQWYEDLNGVLLSLIAWVTFWINSRIYNDMRHSAPVTSLLRTTFSLHNVSAGWPLAVGNFVLWLELSEYWVTSSMTSPCFTIFRTKDCTLSSCYITTNSLQNIYDINHIALQWRHNGRDDVSNHQPYDWLLNRLFRRIQKKHESSASLAVVRGIHRWPVNSPLKWPITRKMFPFDDVIMACQKGQHSMGACNK